MKNIGLLRKEHNHLRRREIFLQRAELKSRTESRSTDFIEVPTTFEPENEVQAQDPLGPALPTIFLDRVLNIDVLSNKEREVFRLYSKDQFDENSRRPELQIVPSKFGFGVRTTEIISKNQTIGEYFGQLSRDMPPESSYSFKISEKNSKEELFLLAEELGHRCVLS